MEDLLAKLVAIPTITDDIVANDMALDFIEHYLAERGMRTERFQLNGHGALVAASRPNNAKTPIVTLAAHTDVVGGSAQVFTLQKREGKLFGRGVYDMKGAIAAYLQTVDDLHRAGALAEYDFTIMITCDEEVNKPGESSVGRLIAAGYRPQVAILPDSTAPGWQIEKIAKGWWRFDVIANGKSVHGSRPWEGESASFKLIQALHELKEHFKDQGPLTDSLNIGGIHGDGLYNQVPNRMLAKVEIRLVDDDSYDKNRALVEAICEKYDVIYSTFILIKPLRPILDHPLVEAYLDTVEGVVGTRPRPYISLGGSDGPYFTAAGIPCIISCPEGGKHHSDEEWVDRDSLAQFLPILRKYLNTVAKD